MVNQNKRTVTAADALDENPLLEIREMQRELQRNQEHVLYTEYLCGVAEFASVEARELLIRQVMRRLVFAVEVMTHEKNFSQKARAALASTLDIAAIFAERRFDRSPAGRQAFTVDSDTPEKCGAGTGIIPIHRSYERH